MRYTFWLSAALVTALSLGGLSIADTQDGWTRIQHPEMPVTMDLPEAASYEEVRAFPLGTPRRKDRAPLQVILFGIRPLDENRLRYHAIEIAMYWLSDSLTGVEARDLETMPKQVHDPAWSEKFLRGVLYRGPSLVEFQDRGFELVGGAPARRSALKRITAPGTPDERTIAGESFLIAHSLTAALVVVVRFDPESTAYEREVVLPRIIRSIRFGEDEDDPLEARVPATSRPG